MSDSDTKLMIGIKRTTEFELTVIGSLWHIRGTISMDVCWVIVHARTVDKVNVAGR